MSLLRHSSEWERPERDRAAASGTQYKIVREAARRIGRGAFACPACCLPMLPGPSVPVTAPIECPFCGEVRPARHFVRPNSVDTPRNQVHLIARLPL
jgi:hypothetical protein